MSPAWFRAHLRHCGYERAARFDELLEVAGDRAGCAIEPDQWPNAGCYLSPVEFFELERCRYRGQWMLNRYNEAWEAYGLNPSRFAEVQ